MRICQDNHSTCLEYAWQSGCSITVDHNYSCINVTTIHSLSAHWVLGAPLRDRQQGTSALAPGACGKEGRGCHRSVNLTFVSLYLGKLEKRVRKERRRGSRGKEDRNEGENQGARRGRGR